MPLARTQDIEVQVEPQYLREQSTQSEYAFMYEVTVANYSDTPVQLMRRHWIITDAMGKVREVEGAGVVGEQPVIAPGESFSYNSWAVLKTPVGTMKGTYQMVKDNGDMFEADIPEFVLNADQTIH